MTSINHHRDRGTVTAEYSIGTVGAVCLAVVLVKFGALGLDGPWLDRLWDTVRDALSWRNLFDGMPRLGLRR